MSTATEWNVTFNTPAERAASFVAQIVAHVSAQQSLRVLDVGCGTGDQTLLLAEALPQATVVGVDISEPNVLEADCRRKKSSACDRVTFTAADYLKYDGGEFDIIISDTTLHLVPSSTEVLFAKLVSELASDGLLAFSIPYRCVYNSLLSGIRHILRATQGGVTDRLILNIAHRLHRGSMPFELLKERVHYMYMPPHHVFSRSLCRFLVEERGLTALPPGVYPHDSLGQLKHSLNFFRHASNATTRPLSAEEPEDAQKNASLRKDVA